MGKLKAAVGCISSGGQDEDRRRGADELTIERDNQATFARPTGMEAAQIRAIAAIDQVGAHVTVLATGEASTTGLPAIHGVVERARLHPHLEALTTFSALVAIFVMRDQEEVCSCTRHHIREWGVVRGRLACCEGCWWRCRWWRRRTHLFLQRVVVVSTCTARR